MNEIEVRNTKQFKIQSRNDQSFEFPPLVFEFVSDFDIRISDFYFLFRHAAMSLFAASEEENRRAAQPLAARMRPTKLDEFVGQQHFLGEGKLLRRLLAADRLGSVIFYGPPGTGKTTLARLLARESRSHFQQISAVASGVKELREVLTRGPRPALGYRPADAAVRRRDPSLQQGPAGRAPAGRGGGRSDPGGGDDREPFFHGQ